MSDKPAPAARPPLKRPPLVTGEGAQGQSEWQDAFYVQYSNDPASINHPWYIPMSMHRIGPFSTYDAASQAGRDVEITLNANGHSWFTVERRQVSPDIAIEYIDKPTVLNDEWDDSSQFSSGMPGIEKLVDEPQSDEV